MTPVMWPFDTDLVYDGQGIRNIRMAPRQNQDPGRVDGQMVRVGETFRGNGSVESTASARRDFPDAPERCLGGTEVVVLDTVIDVVESGS